MLRLSDGILIVLDDHYGIALVFQGAQRVEQQSIVSGMKPDCRFIEDVAHPAQIRPQLRSEPNALRFSAT